MALHDRVRKLTYQDYELIPEDGQRHEILDGEHHVTASPFLRHQSVSSRLHSVLGPFVFRMKLGHFFASPTDVVLSPYDIVQPDLLFVSNQRAAILTEKNVQGAPDLVIEILSVSTVRRDKILKRERYERFGVLEYWLVDPQRRTVEVYRQEAERFQRAALLSALAGESVTSPLLPELSVPLSEIFAGPGT